MCSVAAANARRLGAFVAWLICGCSLVCAGAADFAETQRSGWLTNLSQLRSCASQTSRVSRPFQIQVEVVDVDNAAGVMLVRDASGSEFLRLDLTNQDLHAGSTVQIEGSGCAVRQERFGLTIVRGLMVDNDGLHPLIPESGSAFLSRGANPIRLEWFQWYGDSGLNVEYEGPNLPRQKIPASVLLRNGTVTASGSTNLSPGLDFQCYEGNWDLLPDFRKLTAVRAGVTTNFNLNVRTRSDLVGLTFDGFISIPEDGVYKFYVTSDDGARLFVGQSWLNVRVLNQPSAIKPKPVQFEVPKTNERVWVTLEGVVNAVGVWSAGGELYMQVGDDDIQVEIFEGNTSAPNDLMHGRVQVRGIYENVFQAQGKQVPGRVLALNWKSIKCVGSDSGSEQRETAETTEPSRNEMPTLRTAADIKALSPEMADWGIPVLIRGVVTASSSKNSGAVIQDSTRGVYVDVYRLHGTERLQRGEYCEVEGVTGRGGFAPILVANRITHLGAGAMPKPVRATWDQLVNGSLDTEYAEIDGVVVAVDGTRLALLTEGGKMSVDLREFQPEALRAYENAVIRIRGCFFVSFNSETRKLEAGSLGIMGPVVEVLEPPPTDFFRAPRKSIGDLLFYDAKAAPFRRLKTSGQVILSRPGVCFLTDGTNGLYVTTREQDRFAVGDLVEAVGFLQLGGNTPELRNAMVLKTGHGPLVAPKKLPVDQLFQKRNAGTLVQVDATLINHWRDASEQVMELQSGFLAFKARIQSNKVAVPMPPLGSRMQLTGVYAPQGTETSDHSVSSFNLLLSSARGMRVLATPPWWTLKRMLILAGVLAVILFGVLIWNQELHSKVEQRGRQLESEISNRRQAELKQAAEAERARIARDLHDDLGTGLTEVSLLASAGLGQFLDGEKIRDRFHNIADKARELVSNLDVIVWAIDPRRNSLQSFADYLGRYAMELFSSTTIDCRLRIRMERGEIALMEPERHSLFLAVKEALNNIIRHAEATEVELQIFQAGDRLCIVISDNGHGFALPTNQQGNGITNLQERLQAMHGTCRFDSQPGKGTTVEFSVPLPSDPVSSHRKTT